MNFSSIAFSFLISANCFYRCFSHFYRYLVATHTRFFFNSNNFIKRVGEKEKHIINWKHDHKHTNHPSFSVPIFILFEEKHPRSQHWIEIFFHRTNKIIHSSILCVCVLLLLLLPLVRFALHEIVNQNLQFIHCLHFFCSTYEYFACILHACSVQWPQPSSFYSSHQQNWALLLGWPYILIAWMEYGYVSIAPLQAHRDAIRNEFVEFQLKNILYSMFYAK